MRRTRYTLTEEEFGELQRLSCPTREELESMTREQLRQRAVEFWQRIGAARGFRATSALQTAANAQACERLFSALSTKESR